MYFPKPNERDEKYKDLALIFAVHCVRNTIIEEYHLQGKISDPEMMAFNKEVANNLYTYLQLFFNPSYENQLRLMLQNPMFAYKPPGWDRPIFNEWVEKYIKKNRLDYDL